MGEGVVYHKDMVGADLHDPKEGSSPTFADLTVTSITIGANTLDTNEWAFLDGQDQSVISGSSPTFDGSNFTGIDADDVDIADAGSIITATEVETALQEVKLLENYANSPMVVTGGEVSEGTNAGTFKVGALTALLRATDSLTGA